MHVQCTNTTGKGVAVSGCLLLGAHHECGHNYCRGAHASKHTDDGPAAKITNLQPWSQSVNPRTTGPPAASTTSPRPLSFLRLTLTTLGRCEPPWMKRTRVEVDQPATSCCASGLSISALLHFLVIARTAISQTHLCQSSFLGPFLLHSK